MLLPVDTDILRMRIQKECENKFRMEIEGRQAEIERISEVYYEIKRQNEILKTTLENLKYESEKIIEEVKSRHKNEVAELIEENYSLQLKIDDPSSKDKDLIRSLRRDADDYKRRLSDL